MPVICTKCGKKAYGGYPSVMVRKNKTYHYTRFVHYIKTRKRKSKRKYCYAPALASKEDVRQPITV